MFNTLKFAKMLEDAGFSRIQAETSIKILVEIMEDKLATKLDIAELNRAMKLDIAELARSTKEDIAELARSTQEDIAEVAHNLNEFKSSVKAEFTEIRGELAKTASKEDFLELKHEMRLLKSDLTIKMGAMLTAAVAVVTALHKIL